MSKLDLTTIDFDNIQVREMKYNLSSFEGDIIFVLPPLLDGVGIWIEWTK